MFLYFLMPVDYVASIAIGTVNTILFATLIPLTRSIEIGQLLTIYSQFAVTALAGIFAVYQINILRRRAFLNELKIAEQHRQHFDLLTRILPRSIVERMDQGEAQIADDVPDAVVLFADVVGFTETAARNRPGAVVSALNQLFESIDERVAYHGLEKIKTIGDAYMVAGGLHGPSTDHVGAAARLALDMIGCVAGQQWPDGTPVAIRVGINAGPVLAGVIGNTRFGFDIWGDTVNVASRLQESADPGTIRISPAVHSRLAGRCVVRSLGPRCPQGHG